MYQNPRALPTLKISKPTHEHHPADKSSLDPVFIHFGSQYYYYQVVADLE